MIILRVNSKQNDNPKVQRKNSGRYTAQAPAHRHPDNRQEKKIEKFGTMRIPPQKHNP